MGSRKPSPPSKKTRLQKFLADSGLGSRRACEILITEGRVTVNGLRVDRLGHSIDPLVEEVLVDGQVVRPEKLVHLALNKPPGVLCTSSDPQGRQTCRDLVARIPERVYTVGRLDRESEGLLLMTNDGPFAHVITHPRHHVAKRYLVQAETRLSREDTERLLNGVWSEGERLCAATLRRRPGTGRRVLYDLELREGRNRQIRRMFAAVGIRILRLQRVAIGSLKLGRLPVGAWRELTQGEVQHLMDEARREEPLRP